MGLALNQRWCYSLGTSGWPHAWWKRGSEKQCLSLWGSLSGFRVSCPNNTASLGWFQALQLDIKILRNLLQQLVSTRSPSPGTEPSTSAGPSWSQMPKEILDNSDTHPLKLGEGKGAWSTKPGCVLFLLRSEGGADCICTAKRWERFTPELLKQLFLIVGGLCFSFLFKSLYKYFYNKMELFLIKARFILGVYECK